MHISSIKMRGFKSFKKADLELPPDFICLAGPNGSGKTNILDAIRFALGETSLRALRAKKVSDLICHNSKFAEVAIAFQDNGKQEIRRAIREDGKVKYMLNGERTTRGAIVELLKKYNLDNSGRNIIAQGEVQRIIEMSGRERRGIIDSVAGISEFEEKKKEAMGELEIVDRRMSDANLVLGERTAYLVELAREKERALRYSSSQDSLKKAKATLINIELDKSEKRFEKLKRIVADATASSASISEKMKEIDAQVQKSEEGKTKITQEISAKEERDKLFREMETARAEISSKKEALASLAENISQIAADMESIEGEIEGEKKALSKLSSEMEKTKKDLAPLEGLRFEHTESASVSRIRDSLKKLEEERNRIKEQVILSGAQIESTNSLIEEKQKALETESSSSPGKEEANPAEEIAKMREQMASLVGSLDRLFSREKELNEENASLDRETLQLHEKVATLRAQTSPSLMNPALQFISELKSKGEVDGIHGTVAELIEFTPKHSKAIDAAGGPRLLYVVVDCADVAIKIISLLKSSGRGRATFIPIREVSSAPIEAKGGMGPLVDFVKTDPRYRKAVDFVFGNTLLTEDAKSAKKMGVGTERMVTLDGDLFEKSGIITGGTLRAGAAAAVQLSKAVAELDEKKKRKTGILDDLTQLRSEMSVLRREKAEVDVSLRKKEVELDSRKEKIAEMEKREKRAKEAIKEVESLMKGIESLRAKLDSFNKKFSDSEDAVKKAEKDLQEEISREASLTKSKEKEMTEKAKLYSDLRSLLEAKSIETEMRQETIKGKNQRISQLRKTHSDLGSKHKSSLEYIEKREKELALFTEKVGASDRASQKLIDKMKEFDALLQELGKKKGEFNIELAKHTKALTASEVESASIETRITDLRAECEEFKGIEVLDKGKEELMELMKSSEAEIAELGAVNMAAPELHEQKSKEVSEMREKIEKLRVEKEAIINMINGIEDKKKEAFFETFHAVDKNFKELFNHLNIGEGHLLLDKPSTPFESGLYIKVARAKHDHALESLSGGEKSLIALMFAFSLQFYKPAPFYILDEVDSALDKINSKNLAILIKRLAPQAQFLLVSHNDIMMGMASAVLGVAKVEGLSKVVGVKLDRNAISQEVGEAETEDEAGSAKGKDEGPSPPSN